MDELSSGIRKVVKYIKVHGEELPAFKDGDVFRTFVPYDKESDEIEEVNNISNEQLRYLIYEFIKNNDGCNRCDINNYVYPILNEEIDLICKRIKTNLAILGRKNIITNFSLKTKMENKIVYTYIFVVNYC